MIVNLIRVDPNSTVPMPAKATEDAAGFDLCAAERVIIPAGRWKLVRTGWIMVLARGWEGQIRPRSGLALKHGITVLNAPGTIDADYRGEVGVVLMNHDLNPYTVEEGDRIAQLVIAPIANVLMETASPQVLHLRETARGAGGFGSTGH